MKIRLSPGGRKSGEEGVVLILIVMLIVITVSTVYSFARTSILEVMSLKQRDARVRADLLARSGIEIAVRALLDDKVVGDDLTSTTQESQLDSWRILNDAPLKLSHQEGSLRITIEDSGSRISLNALIDGEGVARDDSRPFLIAVIERILEHAEAEAEPNPEKIEELADALLDWLDTDEDTRLGDDERRYYERDGSGGPPLNRPILALDELSDVPGIDGPLLSTLKSYFLAHPMFPLIERSGVNPNTAPPHILGLIYQGTSTEKRLLDNDAVFQILKARDEGLVFCREGVGEESCTTFPQVTGLLDEGIFPPLQYESDIFQIRSVAEVEGSRACMTKVIDRGDPEALVTLYFSMEC